jgi:hypothetical protein
MVITRFEHIVNSCLTSVKIRIKKVVVVVGGTNKKKYFTEL